MRWYSVKKYIPPIKNTLYFVRVANGDIFVAKIESYNNDGRHIWISDDNMYFDDYQITHFCFPDPVEVEEWSVNE